MIERREFGKTLVSGVVGTAAAANLTVGAEEGEASTSGQEESSDARRR
jgi:hypothetical protein